MTPAEFAAALAETRLKPAAAESARLVLVEGLKKAEVARRLGRTSEAVRMACARVENAHKRIVRAPLAWVACTVVVPGDVVAEVRAIEKRELAALARRVTLPL